MDNQADLEHESQVRYTPLRLAAINLVLREVSEIKVQNKYKKIAPHIASDVGQVEVMLTLFNI